MDKLIYDGRSVTISNDGAQIMNLLDIVHPAARTLVDIAKSQDAEVGDGTTTVVLLAGELLDSAKSFVQEGVHPQSIIRGYRKAVSEGIKHITELAHKVDVKDSQGMRQMLERVAGTALNSKLICANRSFFAPMIVDAVTILDNDLDTSFVGIKKVPGGSVTESFLVKGVAFKKTFSYAGFEQQPKSFKNPKILCLNVELELKSEKENAEVRIDDPDQYQSIVDAEWNIIYEKLDLCVKSGAKIILSKLPIGDLATQVYISSFFFFIIFILLLLLYIYILIQYFADRGLFCAGRVTAEDLDRVCKATGARVQTSVNGLTDDILGKCGDFQERQIGSERYNLFTECPCPTSATIILRGGSEQFLAESERSVHDSIEVVKRCISSSEIVPGGGAIEMEVSRFLKEYSRTIEGKLQLIINNYAKALEVIPRQISDNAGFDSTDIMNALRQKHYEDIENGMNYGVDIENEGICNTYERYVWEPAMSKINSLSAATEAACLVLSIDETVKNPQSEYDSSKKNEAPTNPISVGMGGQGMRGMVPGGGRGRSAAMAGVHTLKGRGGK